MSARTRYGWSEVVSATSRGNLPSAVFERLSVPMTYAIANRTSLSANQVTWAGGLCGLAGCGLFLSGHPLMAASAWFAFAMLDCSDGAIARLRGQASATGADIDLWTDRIVLLAAGLSFSWAFAARGDMLAAWLVQAYLAAHYCTDLGWLMAERLRANTPPQFEALKAELEKGRMRAASPWPAWVHAIGRFERAMRPQPWLCNILFLLGPSLAVQHERAALGVALTAILWWLGFPRLARLVRRKP